MNTESPSSRCREDFPQPLPLQSEGARSPSWEPLCHCGITEAGDTHCPARREPYGLGRASSQSKRSAPLLPATFPSSNQGVLRVAADTDPISNPRRQRDPGAECTARATRTPLLPPTCPSRPRPAGNRRAFLFSARVRLARPVPAPRSSRPPGHPRSRTSSGAREQVASETSARQSPLTHPEDEVKSEEQVFDALATPFDRHGANWTCVGQEARTAGTEETRQRTETR